MPLLTVRDLSVSFETRDGTVRAVNEVTFSLEAGKVLALLGESGSGKSVTLRAILGLHQDARTGGHVGGRRRDDFARHVAARDMRQRNRDPRQAATLPQVEMIQRARADAYECFAGSRHRIRRVLVAQDVWTAMLMEANGLHRQLVSWRIGELATAVTNSTNSLIHQLYGTVIRMRQAAGQPDRQGRAAPAPRQSPRRRRRRAW